MTTSKRIIDALSSINESSGFKVETYSGLEDYDISKVKSQLNALNSDDTSNLSSDNLTGWLYRALLPNVKARSPAKKKEYILKAIKGILSDAVDGRVKKVEFKRDQKGTIIDVKYPDYKSYY